MTLPQSEKVFALTRIESLAHLLDACSGVLAKTALELAVHVERYFFVELVRRTHIALLVEIFKDRIVDVFLGSSKMIQIDSAIGPTAIFR